MNWDQIEGNWKQFKGEMKRRWGKFTDDDFTAMDGHKDKFLGKLQERYGYTKEQADQELNDFTSAMDKTDRERMKM